MNLRPYTIARYGVYTAASIALMSVWLGTRAGVALDYALLRSVFFFVIVAVLGFGAEAVLLTTPPPLPSVQLPEPGEINPELELE